MRQVFQSLGSGETTVLDVPAPGPAPGHVLVRTEASIISAGTERMLVSFGQANLVQKARQQPERVKQVLDKVATDGLSTTVAAVRGRLAEPLALGYASAGTVIAVGEGVDDVIPGDRVAGNGPHAEVSLVPRTLLAKIPNGPNPMTSREAAFATIGSIALQSVRLAEPTLGERFVVTGLGLVGLLTTQLLLANGCQVLGLDFDESRLALAAGYGAQTYKLGDDTDAVAAARRFAGNDEGVDGVIVAASTDSDGPMQEAIQMCRRRGRVVMVGVAGLQLSRSDLFEREVSVRVSCSYGPGRYDAGYESGLQDFPLPYVRWTAGRNMEAFLDQIAAGRIDVKGLLTHNFHITDAIDAYGQLIEDPSALGISLEYPTEALSGEVEPTAPDPAASRTVLVRELPRRTVRPRLAIIGAGNFTSQTLLPALADVDAELSVIVSQHGGSAGQLAGRFNIASASTDWRAVIDSGDVDAVFVTTRHDNHAEITLAALTAGVHVYCEKPLALKMDDIDAIESLLNTFDDAHRPLLRVGFNRRYAPLALELRSRLAGRSSPAAVMITVNAGFIPADHWVHDPAAGGGRIVGEACHFIDLAAWLLDTLPVSVQATYGDVSTRDHAHLTLTMEDGSTAVVNYLPNGHPRHPKESITVFASNAVHELNNWRTLRATPKKSYPNQRSSQDKGHTAAMAQFVSDLTAAAPHDAPLLDLASTRRSIEATY